MNKKILVLLIFCVLLYFFNSSKFFLNFRQALEKKIVFPFYRSVGCAPCAKELKALNQEVKIRALEEENQILKKQLGFLPEKQDLLSAEVINSTDQELYLRFPYETKKPLLGREVIYQNIYIGKVIRQGAELLVVEKPTVSRFVVRAETESGVHGLAKGEYNETVYFETALENPLFKNDLIYVFSQNTKYILGKVNKIIKNEREAKQRGNIDYLPQKMRLKFVFLVL